MLRADDVVRRYGTGRDAVTALDGVSIRVAPGERVGLVGRSGSGKSTLARVLAMLERPDAGGVIVDDERVTSWGVGTPRHLRRQVQLIWQSPRLASDPRLRLRDLVLEPLRAHRARPRSRAEQREILGRWAALVGMTAELADRFPHEVSDGQLQRACLARALILEPRYLVCDEMSSMLDVSTQASLLEVIAERQRTTDMGVLLVTHDHVLAEHWCDRIVELEAGRVAEAPVV